MKLSEEIISMLSATTGLKAKYENSNGKTADYNTGFWEGGTTALNIVLPKVEALESENASLRSLLDECRQCLEMARDGQEHIKGMAYDAYVRVLDKIAKIGGVV